jgi:hypothetical protein
MNTIIDLLRNLWNVLGYVGELLGQPWKSGSPLMERPGLVES